MTPKLYVARNPAVTARRLGSETLVMSSSDSTLFTLNEIASLLWEAADGVTPLDQVVADKICSDFDVEAETAFLDATAIVKTLAARGVLLISDRPIAQSRQVG